MDDRRRVRLSKLLSAVLRHDPSIAGVTLDRAGWAAIDALVDGLRMSRTELDEVTTTRPGGKDRFEVSADGTHVRARYGHSVDVDLGYRPARPPAVLYHGTAIRVVDQILAQGIAPRGRQQVHLSGDVASARRVGRRHGRPAVLAVDAAGMDADGSAFHRLPDDMWLTDRVPASRIIGVVDRETRGPSA